MRTVLMVATVLGVLPGVAQSADGLRVAPVVVCSSAKQVEECNMFTRGVFAVDMAGPYTSFVHRMEPAGLTDDDGRRVKIRDFPPSKIVTPEDVAIGCGLDKKPLGELDTPASRCLKSYARDKDVDYMLAWEILEIIPRDDGYTEIQATLWALERREGATGSPVARSFYFVVQNDASSLLITDALRESIGQAVTRNDPNSVRHGSIAGHLGDKSLVVLRSRLQVPADGSVSTRSVFLDNERRAFLPRSRVLGALTGAQSMRLRDAKGEREIRLGLGVRRQIHVSWVDPFVGVSSPDQGRPPRVAQSLEPSVLESPGMSSEWYKEPSIIAGVAGVVGGMALTLVGSSMVGRINDCVSGIDPVIPLPEARADYQSCTEDTTAAQVYVGIGAVLAAAGIALPLVDFLWLKPRKQRKTPPVTMGVAPWVGGATLRLEGQF